MAEIDDLKAAVAQMQSTVQTDVVNELKALADKLTSLAGAGTINPADVEAAAQSINTVAQNLEAAVASAKSQTGV